MLSIVAVRNLTIELLHHLVYLKFDADDGTIPTNVGLMLRKPFHKIVDR